MEQLDYPQIATVKEQLKVLTINQFVEWVNTTYNIETTLFDFLKVANGDDTEYIKVINRALLKNKTT